MLSEHEVNEEDDGLPKPIPKREEEVDDGESSSKDNESVHDLLRVKFIARWRTFARKFSLPCINIERCTSKDTMLDSITDWARGEVNKQLPARYSIHWITSTVYF